MQTPFVDTVESRDPLNARLVISNNAARVAERSEEADVNETDYRQMVPSVQARVPAVVQQGTPAVHLGHADASQLLVAGEFQRSEGPRR